jgi:hypothetical protein
MVTKANVLMANVNYLGVVLANYSQMVQEKVWTIPAMFLYIFSCFKCKEKLNQVW